MRAAALFLILVAAPALAWAQAQMDARPMSEPGVEDFRRVYPGAALERNLSANVVLGCAVETTGALSDCEVLAEDPTSYGFGDAALELAATYVYSPASTGGAAFRSRTYVHIDFDPPPPPTLASRLGLPAAIIAAWVVILTVVLVLRRRRSFKPTKEQT